MGSDPPILGVVGREGPGQFRLLDAAELQAGDDVFVVSVAQGVVVVTAMVRAEEQTALAEFLVARGWGLH